MINKKIILIIALIALASLIIGSVSATDYEFWDTHYVGYNTGGPSSGSAPNGIMHLYMDTGTETWPTLSAFCTGLGGTCYNSWPMFRVKSTTANIGAIDFAQPNLNYAVDAAIVSGNFITGTDCSTNQSLASYDGYAIQGFVTTVESGPVPYGPMLVVHRTTAPLDADFSYTPSGSELIAPISVLFTDASTGKKPDTFWWEIAGPNNYFAYGEGMPNFNGTFVNPGSYEVSLVVTNGTDTALETKTIIILNEAGSYSLTMYPDTGTTATNFTAAITAGVDELGAVLNQFTISCAVGGKVSYCTTDGKDPIFIKQNDGNWYLDGDMYSATFPDEIPLKFNVPGIHTITAWFFTTDPTDMGTEASDEIEITSTPGQIKLSVEVRDGSSNALIGGSDILLKKEDGTWDNQTVGSGFRDYYVPGGNNLGIGATAPGYTDSGIEYSRFYADAKKIVLLSRIPDGVPEGNNTLSVYVRKGGGSDVIGLEGATVKLNDGQTKLTPGSGLAQFLVLDGKTYFITVTKTGYEKMVRNLAVSGSVNSITMDMLPVGVTTSPTLAPGETPAPGTTTLAPGTTYPPGVPMPGTTVTYPPGVPIIGGDGSTVATNGTARDIAVQNLETWMIWGGTAFVAIFAVMFIGFSGDALKKWSWLWK